MSYYSLNIINPFNATVLFLYPVKASSGGIEIGHWPENIIKLHNTLTITPHIFKTITSN